MGSAGDGSRPRGHGAARGAPQHGWVVEAVSALAPPFFTCEAVLAEAMHLARRVRGAQDALLAMVERGSVRAEFSVQAEVTSVRALMAKYRDRPMDLADACLVRMAELEPRASVLTLDSDFAVYRRNGRHAIRTIRPT